MAAILPDKQVYVELVPGITIGLHLVTPVSTADTFDVPNFHQTDTNSVSSRELRLDTGNTATITDDASTPGNEVAVAGTAGSQVLVVTVHRGTTAFGNEDRANDPLF